MRESHFNTEIVNSLKDCGAWAYKISDMLGVRFTAEKPFDIIGCFDGIAFAIESKQIKKWQAFGMRFLRESQIENLQRIEDVGGQSFVFVNVRISASRAKKTKRENRLIIFRYADLKYAGVVKQDKMRMMPSIQGFKKRFNMQFFLERLIRKNIIQVSHDVRRSKKPVE